MSLGSGPAGGVQTYNLPTLTSFTPDRVIVQGTNPVFVDGLVRITTLTQSGQISGSDTRVSLEGNSVNGSPNNLPGPSQNGARQLLDWLRHTLDSFFELREMLSPPPSGTGQNSTGFDFDLRDGKLGMSEKQPVIPAHLADEVWVGGFLQTASESNWSGLLGALAGAALIGSVQKSRRRAAWPVLQLLPEECN